MPLQSNIFDFAPEWMHFVKVGFVISSAFSGALSIIGAIDTPDDFSKVIIYALAGAIVAMCGTGAVMVKWAFTKGVRVVNESSKTNRELLYEIKELRHDSQQLRNVMDKQVGYWEGVGMNITNIMVEAATDSEREDGRQTRRVYEQPTRTMTASPDPTKKRRPKP